MGNAKRELQAGAKVDERYGIQSTAHGEQEALALRRCPRQPVQRFPKRL